jgi:high-affinity K+ transport system ATPase subunit B
MATANQTGSAFDEYVEANTSMEEAQSLVDLAGKPLVVLTAGEGSNQSWFTKQDHLATLSSNSLHRVVEGATHASLADVEQDTSAVVQAISQVVTSVRTGTPLAGLGSP